LNIFLATILGILTDKEDTPYFALMVVAVLEATFRFELPAIVTVVTVVDVSQFWQVRWFFDNHPPLDVGEYYEAGISSVLFLIVGVLVWLLLADLRGKEAEKELIVRTLTSTHGAQAEAARRMGLSRSALAYKLTKYAIRSAD
jgi:hypothetical protein